MNVQVLLPTQLYKFNNCCLSYYIVGLLDLVYFLFSYVNIRMMCVCLFVCVCVCVSVCLFVWYVILEHIDKNVRVELIWRVLIATIKMPIHIFQSKFSFHVQRNLKHTIHIFVS